jgi:hypothetical protein
LKTEIRKRADREYEVALEKINKDTADTTTYLKLNGVKSNQDGTVELLDSIDTGFEMYDGGAFANGRDAFVYPPRDMDGKNVIANTPAGVKAYVVDQASGNLYYVTLPGSYQMQPQKEYTVGPQSGWRFVEGTVAFESSVVRSRPQVRSKFDSEGNLITADTGVEGPAREEKAPVVVRDINTGNQVDLFGTYTVMVPFSSMRDELRVAYPFLQQTHADLKTRPGGSIPITNRPLSSRPQEVQTTGETKTYKNASAINKAELQAGDTVVIEKGDRAGTYVWSGTKLRKQ